MKMGAFPMSRIVRLEHAHILQSPAVHRFERQAAAVVEDAIRDGHVLEPAVASVAELDAAGRPAARSRRAFVSAVEERAFVVTAHLAAVDGDVLRRAVGSQDRNKLEADAVMRWAN